MSGSTLDEEKVVTHTAETSTNSLDVDLTHYHEQCAGRLVLDPKSVGFFLSSFSSISLVDRHPIREAGIEFGSEVAARLKLSPDGKFVLWPQPSDNPEDPQNVRPFLKIVITTVSLTIIHLVVGTAEDHPAGNHHARYGSP